MPKFKLTNCLKTINLYFSIQLIIFLLQFQFLEIQARYIPERSQNSDFKNLIKDSYLKAYFSNKWKTKGDSTSISKQDSGPAVPILSDLIPSIPPDDGSYLPDLGLVADFGSLVTRDFPASPLVKLSRDLFESEQCAQFVSCEVSKFSRRHEPLQWIHNFLLDFPFRGDLADKLKFGSEDSVRTEKCGFNCNPLSTLTRGLKMLTLLHEIVGITNK